MEPRVDLNLPFFFFFSELQNCTQFLGLVPEWKLFFVLLLQTQTHVLQSLSLSCHFYLILTFHLLLLSPTSFSLPPPNISKPQTPELLSPLPLVCCCFPGADLARACICWFGCGSDISLFELLNLLKTSLLEYAMS